MKIRLRRTTEINGEVPLFFAKVMGVNSAVQESEATAAFLDNFNGFKAPTQPGECLEVLPFVLDKQTWHGLLAGGGTDSWTYNAETVRRDERGRQRPRDQPLPARNRLARKPRHRRHRAAANNSTCDLARQIRHGLNRQDLDLYGRRTEARRQRRS